MTRTERQHLKSKYRRKVIAGYSMVGLFFLNLAIIFILRPRLMGMESDMLRALILMIVLLVPIFVGLYFCLMSMMERQELLSEFQRLYDLKNRHRFKLFYANVQKGLYDEARKSFNLIIMRGDTYRVFAHGMLMALMELHGDEKQKEQAKVRMNKILYNDTTKPSNY